MKIFSMNNRKRLVLIALFISVNIPVATAQYATWIDDTLVLNNGLVERVIVLPSASTRDAHFVTTSYQPVTGKFDFFRNENPDFSFQLDDIQYTGLSDWTLVRVQGLKDDFESDGAKVILRSKDAKVELEINFLLYPELPVIRKSLTVKNLTDASVSLESVDIEKFLVTDYYPSTFSWVYSDYGRRKSLGPYESNLQDALVILHNMDWEAGIVIGNEATGVLKRTAIFWEAPEIVAGLTHENARYPFLKWIEPGEAFTTSEVFTMVYNNQKTPDNMLNKAVPDYVRNHLGTRLSELTEKPTFVYNTWNPFEKNINEKLIMDLAKAAAAAGMKEFVIDDGWNANYGDWEIDYEKFPNGLKPVFDYIKSLGMKPGLWISVGSASEDSKVFQEHPEWFIKDKKGNIGNLHADHDNTKFYSACFTTGWKDYIKDILLKLALDYGLEYVKLDFSVVSSAYIFDSERSGCYAKDHDGHKDQRESIYANYERMWELFDELHEAKPNLFIDCTFETMGGLQMIDYAMLKHAEGNWLSNFDGEKGEKTDLRVRNMAWWRSPAIPATALVIGNPQMQDEGWEMHIKSIYGALPIMLGDPRELSAGHLNTYKRHADWLQKMQKQYDVMSFRQDLPGFGEPTEGFWDGYARINTETKNGGFVGVFRHGALNDYQRVTVNYLDQSSFYGVYDIQGKRLFKLTGKQLLNEGFMVQLKEKYDGKLFEIRRL